MEKGIHQSLAKFTKKTTVGLQPATLLKENTPTQMFSCELCKNFKNTFFIEHLQVTASVCSF